MRLLRNIKKWWPILREDEDWDYQYLLQVINFKLEKMEEYMRKHGHLQNSEEVAGEIDEASYYLKQLISDDFFDHELLDKKWGESEITFNPDGSISFTHKNVKTPEDEAQYRKEFMAEVQKEWEREQSALDNFCQIFKTKLFGWWD